MGKKKIITKEEAGATSDAKKDPVVSKSSKKKVTSGTLHVEATFNNTKVVLSDQKGNTLAWSSAGSLGFRGAKKGTPFAASKVAEILAEKAANFGIKDVNVVVRGVGSGRESTIRSFMGHGFDVTGIEDITPVPHNGVKAKKPRRV